MTSLFDVGKSALNSYRQSLAVTGQNIANINTEGYKKREANLEEVTGSQGSVTSLANQTGLGVRVSDIKRSFDQYLLDRARTASAGFEKLDNYVDQVSQLEDLLLPEKGSLGDQIANFFDSLREVAAAPSELAPRAVAIEQGKALTQGFNTYAQRVEELKGGIKAVVSDSMISVNMLSQQLADVNGRILSTGQSGQSPNSIFDLRDRVISDLSKLVDLTVDYQDRGVVNIRLGGSSVGPLLVEATSARSIDFEETISGLQPVVLSSGARRATNQITAGMVAGLSDAYTTANEVLKEVNQLALLMGREMNAQHRAGITLDGVRGDNIFSSNGMTLSPGSANRTDVTGELDILNPDGLPMSEMVATYSAEEDIWTVTGADLETPLRGARQISGPGFMLRVSGEAATGDTLVISPETGAAMNLRFLLDKPQQLAASTGLLVSASARNASDAIMSAQTITPEAGPKLAGLADVFTNSSSPIEASEFFRDGFVAKIPAGTNAVSLTSLTRQSTARFQLTNIELNSLTGLNFALMDTPNMGPFSFDVRYQTAFPQAGVNDNWPNTSDLADMLNKGVLKTAANETLQDLGLYASGASGQLTLTSAKGNFDTTDANAARLIAGGGQLRAVTSDRIDASDLQIFTSEGRHIAGSALSAEQVAEVMTAENGFGKDALYSGAYLNQRNPAYRGMDIQINRAAGFNVLRTGANGIGATAVAGVGRMPASSAIDQLVAVQQGNGQIHNITLKGGASAADAVAQLNNVLANTDITAEAMMRLELSEFTNAGGVSFGLESVNLEPVEITADIIASDLTNLATAINNQSNRTGVVAHLSANKERVILESASGKDIFLSDITAATPAFKAKVLNEDGSAASSEVTLGGASSGASSANQARFSGVVKMVSSSAFSFVDEAETLTRSAEDSLEGSFVSVASNASADSKLVHFDVQNDADNNEASNDGRRAVAAGAQYNLSVLTSDEEISFAASLSSAEVSPLNEAAVHKAMAEAVRSTALLASLTAGQPAAKPQSVEFTFAGPNVDQIDTVTNPVATTVGNGEYVIEASQITYPVGVAGQDVSLSVSIIGGQATATITSGGSGYTVGDQLVVPGDFLGGTSPADDLTLTVANVLSPNVQAGDTLAIDVAGSTVNVSLTVGMTPQQITQAAVQAVNNANLGVVASALSETTSGVTSYKFTIAADEVNESFTFNGVNFTSIGNRSSLNLTDSIVASDLPENGDSVFVDFAGDSYKIAMIEDEIVVTGGEEGRLTAYFDANYNLQIFAGGTLSGQAITLTGDHKVANNSAAAARFGLASTQMRFSGQDIAPANGLDPLTFSYNGTEISVRLDSAGNIRTLPTTLPAGLNVTFSETTTGRGRVMVTYNSVNGSIEFDTPQDTMGVKVADSDVRVTDAGIRISSVSGDVQKLNVSASSLAEEKIEISDLVVEDLLVFVTGSGAKMVSSLYDIPPLSGEEQEDLLLGGDGIALRAVSEDGLYVEIIDKETGHSMATRVLDEENSVTFNQYQFTLKGQASLDDEFNVILSESGSGDNRNLLKIIAQQNNDMDGPHSGGFSSIFSNIVAGVGASVNASKEALDGAEATKEAAAEAEAEFSGVNLDSEAASLIEFQQAYQASARILSTARELFQTLIDVV
jgi:flagellar hook-associated protein 1 FlgK